MSIDTCNSSYFATFLVQLIIKSENLSSSDELAEVHRRFFQIMVRLLTTIRSKC